MPDVGFLFPAFNDRSSDVNSLLYYCKDPLLIHPEIISDCLGCVEEMTSVVENRIFKNVLEDVINEAPGYDTFEVVRNVQDNINDMLENKVFSMEPTIDKKGVAELLRNSGIKEEHLPIVEKKFEKEKICALGSPKSSHGVFHKLLWKNSDELFGQLNICITESLCCTPEINTTLLINSAAAAAQSLQ